MFSKNGNGFLTGIIVAILIVAIVLIGWLYGSKIKQDIKDKLNNQEQQENTPTDETETQTTASIILLANGAVKINY